MPNSGISFDTALLQKPSQANASIAGVPLRINPDSVNLSYSMKMSQTQTVGGFVFQIYGVQWSDLVVEGEFGAGGWQAQVQFFQYLRSLVQNTVTAQMVQGAPGASQESDGAFRFLFPLLNYDFMVFLKSYASREGQSVELYNENINPSWQLTFTIDNDNSGLDQVAVNNYISRLQAGVGYQPNQYNGPTSSTVPNLNTFLQTYAQGQDLSSFLGGTSGSSPSDPPGSSSAGASAGTAVTSANHTALITQALQLSNVAVTQANINSVNIIVTHESGWNANAQNNWDSNAAAGDPSRGLMQTIVTTFQEYAIPGYNTNIFDPLSNLIAGIRYAVSRYGSLENVPGVVAVNSGGSYVGY